MRGALIAGLTLTLLAAAARAQRPEASALKLQGDGLLSRGSVSEAEAAYRQAIKLDPSYTQAYGALSVHYLRKGKLDQTVAVLRTAVQHVPTYAEGWYNLAYALRKTGQLDAAIEAYRRFAILQPKSADPYFGIGLALETKGQHREAAASFRKYAQLENDPSKRSWVEKALKAAVRCEGKAKAGASTTAEPAQAPKGGAEAKGVETAKTAAAPAPVEKAAAKRKEVKGAEAKVTEVKVTEAKTAAAAAPVDNGGRAEPDEAAKRAPAQRTSSDPETPQRKRAQEHKAAGDRLVQIGRPIDALTRYREAVAEDFTYFAALNELGNVLFTLHRYDEAIQTFRIAVRDNPDYSLGWYNLAYALRKANRLPEAVAAYRKYIKLEPNDADPHYGLGLAYLAMGEKTEAARAFREYIRVERRPAQEKWVHRARAEVAKIEGTPIPTQVERPSSEAAETAAKPKTKAELRAEAKQKAAAERQAKEEARKAAAEEKKRLAAEAKQRAAAERQAKEEARKAAAEEKKRLAAEAKQRAAAERQAKEEARKAAAEEKKRLAAEAKQRAAEAKAGPGKSKQAASEAQAASSARAASETAGSSEPMAADTIESPPLPPASSGGTPTSAAGRLRLQADTLARQDKCAAAIGLYKQAAELDPFLTAAYDGIAYCAFKTGAYAHGAALLSVGLRDNPDYDQGWLHLARLERAGDRRERAVGSYRKLLSKEPRNPDGHLELARTLRSLGLVDQAIVAYRAYLQVESRAGTQPLRSAARAELAALSGERAPSLTGTASAKAESGKTALQEKTPAELKVEAKQKAAEERRAKEEARKAAAEEKRRAAAEARQKAAEERRAKEEARRAAAEEKRRAAAEARQKAAEERKAKLAARKAAAEARKGKGAAAPLEKTSDEALAAEVGRDVAEALPPPEPPGAYDTLKPAPDAARGLVSVADAQFSKQRYDIALGVYQQAVKLDPSATEPLYKAGVAAVALGQMHLAADLFARVVQIDPANATAAMNLKMAQAASQSARPAPKYVEMAQVEAQASIDSHRYALAVRQLDKLIALEMSARLYCMRAQARLGLGHSSNALLDAGRALSLDPGSMGALKVMADAHRQLGRADKALYYYRLYLSRAGGDSGEAERAEVERSAKELSVGR